MKRALSFFSGCGRSRTQTMAAHLMLALALFMILPVERPVLWVLEEWGTSGNEVLIPGAAWAALFAIVGLGILGARSRRALTGFTVAAAALVATVAFAGIITQGLTANAALLGTAVLHIIGSARDAAARPEGGEHEHAAN